MMLHKVPFAVTDKQGSSFGIIHFPKNENASVSYMLSSFMT